MGEVTFDAKAGAAMQAAVQKAFAAGQALNWQDFVQWLGYAVMIGTVVESLATNPAFKGANTLGIVVTNTASGQSETLPVPGVVITF